nr:PREDICTED: uncharacterized protein PF11_0207-like [Bemisia tabaci]
MSKKEDDNAESLLNLSSQELNEEKERLGKKLDGMEMKMKEWNEHVNKSPPPATAKKKDEYEQFLHEMKVVETARIEIEKELNRRKQATESDEEKWKAKEEKVEATLKEHLDTLDIIRNMIYDLDSDSGNKEIKIGRKTYSKGNDTRKNLMNTLAYKKEQIKLAKAELDRIRKKTETKGHEEQISKILGTEETEMEVEIINELKRRRKEALDTSMEDMDDDDLVFLRKSQGLKRVRTATSKGAGIGKESVSRGSSPTVKQAYRSRCNSLPTRNSGLKKRGEKETDGTTTETQKNMELKDLLNALLTQIKEQMTTMKKIKEDNEKNHQKLREENAKTMETFLQQLKELKENPKNLTEIGKLEKELRDSKEELKKMKTENEKLTKTTKEMKEELKKLKDNLDKNGKSQKEENKKTQEKLDKIGKTMITEKTVEKVLKETKSKLEMKETRNKGEKQFKENIINRNDNMTKVKATLEGKTGEETKKKVNSVLEKYPESTITAKTFLQAVILNGPTEEIRKVEEELKQEEMKIQPVRPTGTVFRINYVDEDISTERIPYHIYIKNMKGIAGWTEERVRESITVFADRKRTWTRNEREDVTRWILIRATNGLGRFLTTKSKIFIGFSNCPIFPTAVVTPCGKCGSVYHSTKSCEEKEMCWSCGSTEHKNKDCKDRKMKNCEREGKKETNHHMFDEGKCIIYRKAMERARRLAGMFEKPEEELSTSKEGSFQYQRIITGMETDDTSYSC